MALIGELAAVGEVPRLLLRTRALVSGPRGNGRDVVVFPGFGTNDHVLLPLRQFLRSRGHRPHGWGLGWNDGNVFAKLPLSIERVTDLAERAGRPVGLVGWSLGGVFAREIARDAPTVVHRVVTFGTPLNGPPPSVGERVYTEAARARIDDEIEARNRRPITTPITAIYSRRDQIVDWRTCIDSHNPNVEHIEVSSTHVGMGLDPDVWTLVAERLAER